MSLITYGRGCMKGLLPGLTGHVRRSVRHGIYVCCTCLGVRKRLTLLGIKRPGRGKA